MKGFLKKYRIHLSLPLIVVIAFSIISIFVYIYILAALLCFVVLFLPTLIWCVHAWEKEQEQLNPHFWYKFLSLFIFYGIMIVLSSAAFFSPSSNTESLSNRWYFIGFFSYILYLYGGTYLVGILFGIHWGQKKRMSILDILFSTGVWLLLSTIYFRISLDGINQNTVSGRLSFFWLPVLGSTIALFLSEIITFSIHRLHK